MRAFVTSSTGLLGNNLVRILHEAGHEVWALARSKEKAQQTLGDMAARIVVGDIRKVAEFAPCLKGVDVVFHTAAYFREYYTPGDHSNAVELTNVKGTMELAQAAHAMGVGKMIHTSSAGIVGLQADGSPGDERTPPWPGVTSNLYLNSKRKVEPLLFEFARRRASLSHRHFQHGCGGHTMWDRLRAESLFTMRSRISCLQWSRLVARQLSMSGMWQSPCFALRRSGALESDISSVVVSPSSLILLRILPP